MSDQTTDATEVSGPTITPLDCLITADALEQAEMGIIAYRFRKSAETIGWQASHITTLEAQLQEARIALSLISKSETLSYCQLTAHAALNTLEKTTDDD